MSGRVYLWHITEHGVSPQLLAVAFYQGFEAVGERLGDHCIQQLNESLKLQAQCKTGHHGQNYR